MGKINFIRKWKDKIISELNNDESIVGALGLNPDEDADDLTWVRLFPHYYVIGTQSEVKSYICVEINVPERRQRYGESSSNLILYPTIIFEVVVHQEDMKLNLAGESGTRMDYIAELIEDKYNNRMDFGAGVLKLKSCIAGDVNNTYRVRALVFEATDISGVCEG